MTKLNKILAIAAAAIVLAVSSGASQAGWYVGGSAGLADHRQGCDGLGPNCDDSDVSFSVFGGLWFIPRWLGLELGYYDLGETSFTTPAGSGAREISALQFGVIVGIPVGDLITLNGKFGILQSDVEFDAGSTGGTNNSTDISYGMGATFEVTPNLGIRVLAEMFDNLGNHTDVAGETEVLNYTIGALWTFK
jgi:hypothetical protein